jgi:MFS family permease
VVLTALIAGTALASIAVGVLADRVGRRRCYAVFFCGIAVAGVVVATGAPLWALLIVALTGTLSTDVIAPLIVAGAVKAGYDVALWMWAAGAAKVATEGK